jgi:hypothetical protein
VIVALADARASRWPHARRAAAVAAVGFLVWLGLQFWFMYVLGYSYGDNKSPQLASGGYLVFWLRHETARGALSAMFVEFGALYLLMPFGYLRAPRRLQELALAAIPIACIFGYVQQPDRALWNFHFIVTPLAAVALEALPNVFAAAFVLLFGLSYLRIGAQITAVPEARYAVALTVALAIAAIAAGWRRSAAHPDALNT